jgi:high-affinity iron transporter
MFNVGIITFREGLEMLVVIMALVAYAGKINRKDLLKFIYGGAISGLGVSILTGAALLLQANKLTGYAGNLFNGSIMIFLALFILYYMVWLRRQSKFENLNIEDKYNVKATGYGFFVFIFLTVFRECFEIIMFTLPTMTVNIWTVIFGSIIGLSLAVILALLIYKAAIKISLKVVFDLLTLFLIYIGAEMFGEGLLELIPSADSSLQTAGMLIFGLPTLFIFLRWKIKDYTNKK